MLFRLAADAVLLLHFAFIVFAVGGGLLVYRWRWLVWLHGPAALWAFVVELLGENCPLTAVENSLRLQGGQAGFSGGFLEYYLLQVMYPAGLTRNMQYVLAAAVLLLNVAVYAWIWARPRLRQKNHAGH